MKKVTDKVDGWLLFFYSVPSKPVSSRMKIWRRLAKAGAVQLKGAVYILPYSADRYEFLQWMVSEVISLKGDGTFIRVEKIETLMQMEIVGLFDKQREQDYQGIGKDLDILERKVSSVKKGGGAMKDARMSELFNKCLKEFEEIRGIDFFNSKAGEELKMRIENIGSEIKGLAGDGSTKQCADIVPKRMEDYQGRIWGTRKRPFIDRMASAWLIKRHIDANAVFRFMDEDETGSMDKNMIAFDVKAGEFTHVGDMCTFEVLVKAFGFKDKTLKKIAEIVHDLDLKDDKYAPAEAKGLEEILTGIRKTAKDDKDALEKGMSVFEMLYASKTR